MISQEFPDQWEPWHVNLSGLLRLVSGSLKCWSTQRHQTAANGRPHICPPTSLGPSWVVRCCLGGGVCASEWLCGCQPQHSHAARARKSSSVTWPALHTDAHFWPCQKHDVDHWNSKPVQEDGLLSITNMKSLLVYQICLQSGGHVDSRCKVRIVADITGFCLEMQHQRRQKQVSFCSIPQQSITSNRFKNQWPSPNLRFKNVVQVQTVQGGTGGIFFNTCIGLWSWASTSIKNDWRYPSSVLLQLSFLIWTVNGNRHVPYVRF